MGVKLDVNKGNGPLNCSPNSPEGDSPIQTPREYPAAPTNKFYNALQKKKKSDDNELLLRESKEVLQEHPDLSSTSFYSQPACVLPAPLVQTPLNLAWGRQNQGRHCLVLCVRSCVCFVSWWWWWWWWCSVAPTKWCSQAWNHLSSDLKGLHGFLMMSPYLLYAKYTQWLHSF